MLCMRSVLQASSAVTLLSCLSLCMSLQACCPGRSEQGHDCSISLSWPDSHLSWLAPPSPWLQHSASWHQAARAVRPCDHGPVVTLCPWQGHARKRKRAPQRADPAAAAYAAESPNFVGPRFGSPRAPMLSSSPEPEEEIRFHEEDPVSPCLASRPARRVCCCAHHPDGR